jgi:hypothetical protein
MERQQVLVRKPRLHGDPLLVRADVISEDATNGTLTVRCQGERTIETVAADSTVAVSAVFGTSPQESRQLPIKSYPESRHALCNSLNRGV